MNESGTKIPKTAMQHVYGIAAGVGMGNLVYKGFSTMGDAGLNFLQKTVDSICDS